jgi:hypothetical protein
MENAVEYLQSLPLKITSASNNNKAETPQLYAVVKIYND